MLVDGVCYASSNTFASRKAAEQDAARLAMISITEKIKEEVPTIPPIHEVWFSMLKVSVRVQNFCFNILYELFKNLFCQISLQLFFRASSLSK